MFIKNIAPTILTVLYIQWDPLNCGRWRRHCQSLTINLLSDSVYICTVHSAQFLYFMFFKSYFETNNRLLTLHFPWFPCTPLIKPTVILTFFSISYFILNNVPALTVTVYTVAFVFTGNIFHNFLMKKKMHLFGHLKVWHTS